MSSSYFIDRRSSPLTFFLFCFLVFFFFLKILPLCPLVFLFLLSCCWCLYQWPHSPRSPGLQWSPVEIRRPLGRIPAISSCLLSAPSGEPLVHRFSLCDPDQVSIWGKQIISIGLFSRPISGPSGFHFLFIMFPKMSVVISVWISTRLTAV